MPDDSILVADGGDFVGTAAYVMRPRGPLRCELSELLSRLLYHDRLALSRLLEQAITNFIDFLVIRIGKQVEC